MALQRRATYQGAHGLQEAVVDLVRVGSSGYASGVRQLATRLIRAVPDGVEDVDGFREALRNALAHTTSVPSLRFAGGEIPVDDGGQHRLVDVDPLPDGSGLVLSPEVDREIREVVAERAHADRLARAGVGMTRTLLLSGPPGVGKTMTARWLAQMTELPLVTLELPAVVSSFLGNSGRNIRSVLDYAKSGPCVLLLDEFDALAKRRDDDTDIGELKRIVNVILVELDRWPDTSLLVAATNHAQLLDEAVHRRFDRHIELQLPEQAERQRIVSALDENDEVEPKVQSLISSLTAGASGSDIARLWRNAARRAVMQEVSISRQLLDDTAHPGLKRGPERDRLWLLLSEGLGMSARQIAEKYGVSHPTASSAIKRARAQT